MSETVTLLHTAMAHTTGGRERDASRSADDRLDVRFLAPGSARIGANPEQLFAAAWSACFESAIAFAQARGCCTKSHKGRCANPRHDYRMLR
jgi:osmotically inducible protein OsmC